MNSSRESCEISRRNSVTDINRKLWPGVWSCRVLLCLSLVLGFLLISVGWILVIQRKSHFVHSYKRDMIIYPPEEGDSLTWNFFQDPPIERKVTYHFFTMTNVRKRGIKPKVREIYKILYKVDSSFSNITFTNEFNFVSFDQIVQFPPSTSSSKDLLLPSVDGSTVKPQNSKIFAPKKMSNRVTMNTGKTDLENIQIIHRYNDMVRFADGADTFSVSNFYLLRGKLGLGFEPNVRTKSVLSIFWPQICFPLDFVYHSSYESDGIEIMKFTLDVDRWHEQALSINEVFCPRDSPNCLPPDVINLSKCKISPTPLASLPHFLKLNSSKMNFVGGTKPNWTFHESFLEVDSLSGLTVRSIIRLQFNRFLRRHNGIIVPIFWTEDVFEMTQDGLAAIKEVFYSRYENRKTGYLILLGVGVAVMAISVVVYIIWIIENYRRKKPAILRASIEMSDFNNSQYFSVAGEERANSVF